jgi:hypothetical protein
VALIPIRQVGSQVKDGSNNKKSHWEFKEETIMRKILFIAVMGIFAFMAIHVISEVVFAKDASEYQYEVLSPWAEIDPIAPRGISPRVDTLAGKKIGLFVNMKRAARPIRAYIEKKLKERFPDCQTSYFDAPSQKYLAENQEKYAAWAKEMDAVITAVGD